MLLEVQPPCVTVAPAVRAQVGNPPLRLFFPPVTPAFPQVTGLPRGGQGRDRTAEPSGFQPDALPTELPARAGRGLRPEPPARDAVPTGFEPATSALTGRRAQPSCSTGPCAGSLLCPQRSSNPRRNLERVVS